MQAGEQASGHAGGQAYRWSGAQAGDQATNRQRKDAAAKGSQPAAQPGCIAHASGLFS